MCRDVAQLARSQLSSRYHFPLLPLPFPNPEMRLLHTQTHTNCDICNESLSFVCFGIDFLPFAQSQIVFRKSIQLYRAFPGKLTCCHIPACVPPLPLPLSHSFSIPLSMCLLVNRCWFVYLIDSKHTHTTIKVSFVNLDLCSLPSSLYLTPSLPLPSLSVYLCVAQTH